MIMVKGGEKDVLELKSLFSTAVDFPVGHPLRDLQKQHLYNLEMTALESRSIEESLPGGLISRLGLTPAKLEQLAKARNDKTWQDFFQRIIQQSTLDWLRSLMDYHSNEMERLLDIIAALQDQADLLDQDIEALNNVLDHYSQRQILHIDEPAQRAVNTYAERHNTTIVKPDYDAILEISVVVDQERQNLKGGLRDKQTEYEFHEKQFRQLQDLKVELDHSGDLNQLQTTLLELRRLEQQGETDIANPNNNMGDPTSTSQEAKLTDLFNEQLFDFPPVTEELNRDYPQSIQKRAPSAVVQGKVPKG